MELRKRIEERLAVAQRDAATTTEGKEWNYLRGYIAACSDALEDITDLGIREFEAERRD